VVKKLFSGLKSVFSGLKTGKTLYYPGCITQHKLKHLFDNYKSLLNDIGVDYVVIPEMRCCGSPLLNAGYKDDFEEIKQKNLKILKKNKISRIITNCPHCFDIFKNVYGLNVMHISQVIAENKHKLSSDNNEEISYHDPCLLARQNKIIKEPRDALRTAGFKIKEPRRNKENTFCCGAGGGMKQNSPKIANKIAKERLSQFRTKKVVVSCPYCYLHLKENSKNKKIIDFGEALSEY